jgi:hypothetical protein
LFDISQFLHFIVVAVNDVVGLISQKTLSEITSSSPMISTLIQIHDIVSADLMLPVAIGNADSNSSSPTTIAPTFAPSVFPLSSTCNISYLINIPSTKELGYHTAIEAYTSTTIFLPTSLRNNKFLQFWQAAVNSYQLSPSLLMIEPLSNIIIGPLSSDYNFPVNVVTDDNTTSDSSKFSTAMIITIACAVIMAVFCCPFIALFSLYLARQIMKFRTKVTFVSDENGNLIEMADAHYIEENTHGNGNHSNFLSILPSEQLPHAKPVSAAIFARVDPVVPLLNADREHTS